MAVVFNAKGTSSTTFQIGKGGPVLSSSGGALAVDKGVLLPAGTVGAGTAPLKLASGVNLTTPEDGAIEYDGSNLHFTVGSTRNQLTGGIPKINTLGAAVSPQLTDLAVISQSNVEKQLTVSQLATAGSLRIASGITHMASLAHVIDHIWSAGNTNGGALTDNGDGTVTIAAGECIIRATSGYMSNLYLQPFIQTTLTLTNNVVNWITVTYGAGGTATLGVTTDSTTVNCRNVCHLYRITREGLELHVVDSTIQNSDSNRNYRKRSHNTTTFVPETGVGVLSATNLTLQVTGGTWWYALHEQSQTAFDTNVAGTANANVFRKYYFSGGSWVKVDNVKVLSNEYNNAGTLTALAGNRYSVAWVYVLVGHDDSNLAVLTSTTQYTSLANAQAEAAPSSVPPAISGNGYLIGRCVVQGGQTAPVSVQSSLTTAFQLSPVTDHGTLSGLGDDDHTQYALVTGARDFTGAITTPQVNGSPASGGDLVLQSTSDTTKGNINFGTSTYDELNNRLGVATTTPPSPLSVGYNPDYYLEIADVGTPTATPSETGGSIGAGTYYYAVVANSGSGSTLKSVESAGATISGTTGSITVSWTPVAGAVYYRLYRTTVSGTYTTPAAISTHLTSSSFVDTLASPSSGTPPATDTQLGYGKSSHFSHFANPTGYTEVCSSVVDTVIAGSADSNIPMRAFASTLKVPSGYSYRVGALVAGAFSAYNSGSGQSSNLFGINASATNMCSHSSPGSVYGASSNATALGVATSTIPGMYGSFAQGSNQSAHTVTNLYGSYGTAANGITASAPAGGTVTNMYGGYFTAGDGTANNSTGQYGVYGYVSRTAGGNTSNQFGGYFLSSVTNTSTAAQQYGMYSSAYSSSSGTLATQYGGYVRASNDGAGTITNKYGLFVEYTNAGTVGTSYGLFLSGSNTGTIGTNYGVYQAETAAMNHFGGNVGIVTLVPTAKLHLPAGTAAAGTAPLKLMTGTALTTPEDGAIEYHGSHLYATIGATRYQLDQQSGVAPNLLINPFIINQLAPATSADDTYAHDQWIVLTQTGAIAASTLTDVENTVPYMARLTQSQASAQRMGYAQIIEGKNCKGLRGQTVKFKVGRVRLSSSANIRIAVLEWTGTEDTVTSDVVLDWTSASYTAGGFFLATNITVSGTAQQALTANTLTDGTELSVTLGSTFNNLIIFVWTEATVAQNVTLDLAKPKLGADSVFVWPKIQDVTQHCYWYFEVTAQDFNCGGYGGAGVVGRASWSYATKRIAPNVLKVGTWDTSNCNQPLMAGATNRTSAAMYVTVTAAGDWYFASSTSSMYLTADARL